MMKKAYGFQVKKVKKAFNFDLDEIVGGRGSNSKADNPYAYKWLCQLNIGKR